MQGLFYIMALTEQVVVGGIVLAHSQRLIPSNKTQVLFLFLFWVKTVSNTVVMTHFFLMVEEFSKAAGT